MALERIGNCEILEEIASGGMAVVYKAMQTSLNRLVAIKALKTSVSSELQFVTRFEREALSLAQLQHENIIHVYDFYRERGALFIVMEYVEGLDLFDLLDRCGRFPIEVAAIIAMQVARGLDYAHYRGVVHRDIKPANIMVSVSGGIKLMDFGIARDESFGDLTEAGAGLGTPSYMSPEQILGEKLDFRTDIFSLGVLLYQLVTGKKPFVEDAAKSVMHKIRLVKPESARKLNPDVPHELERIINKCLQKQPRDRYRTTQAMVLALERFLGRRVDMNYSARLVLFLKTHGVISAEEAEKYLEPAGASGGGHTTAAGLYRQTLRRVALVQAIIVAAVTVMIGLIHLAPIGAASSSPEHRGYLRVVARPWAHVYVDGEAVETTPFAAPIELSPGRHRLELKNSYYQEVARTVTIEGSPPEQAQLVTVDLEPQ